MVLASGSPRRQQFLEEMGLVFEVALAELAEIHTLGEAPPLFAERMAREKGQLVGNKYPDRWIVSGDTIVCLKDSILGKPVSDEDAVSMLMQLSGCEHTVITGFCVYNHDLDVEIVSSALTRVHFSEYSEEVARGYVRTGEPLDKAGGYGIQGRGGVLVKSIFGSYTNVVGMPMFELMETLVGVGAVEVSGTNEAKF